MPGPAITRTGAILHAPIDHTWIVGGRRVACRVDGARRKFIDIDVTKFTGTAGVGYKVYETQNAFDDAGVLIEPGGRDSEAVFRGTLDYDHEFTETTPLLDKFVVEAGPDNTFAQNDLTLQVKMNAVLALAVGYSVRHNTDPRFGFEQTDTLTTINLVYEIL